MKDLDTQSKADELKEDDVTLGEQQDTQVNQVEQTEEEKAQVVLNAADEPKTASAKALLIGIGCFILLFGDLIAATVLLINQIFVGAIVCAAIFVIVIISAFVTVAIRDHKSMSKNVRYAKKIVGGKVKSCVLSNKKSDDSNSSAMIAGVLYKVIVAAEDGRKYSAYSQRLYETDENIYIAVMSNKRGIVVEESEKDSIKLDGREGLAKGIRTRHNYARRHHH